MRVFFLLAVVLLLAPTLVAQPRPITEAEFAKIKNEAMKKRTKVPLRVKRSWKTANSDVSSEALYEYSRNDTFHFVYVTPFYGIEKRTESIQIGKAKYVRNADGTWTKDPLLVSNFDLSGYGSATGDGSDRGSGTGNNSGAGDSSGGPASSAETTRTAEHFYVGKEILKGQECSHYRTIRTVTYTGKTGLSRETVEDYWINANGLLLKETHETSRGAVPYTSSTIIEYEYPKEINIVPPIPD